MLAASSCLLAVQHLKTNTEIICKLHFKVKSGITSYLDFNSVSLFSLFVAADGTSCRKLFLFLDCVSFLKWFQNVFSQAVAAEAAEGEALEVRERRWKMGTKPGLVGFWLLELPTSQLY